MTVVVTSGIPEIKVIRRFDRYQPLFAHSPQDQVFNDFRIVASRNA